MRIKSFRICNGYIIFNILWKILIAFALASESNNYGRLKDITYIDKQSYQRSGDITIGVLMSITDFVGPQCSAKVRTGSVSLEYPECIAFAVDAVNRDQSILPNITLGFVVLNDCGNEKMALAQALTFLPSVRTGEVTNQSSSATSLPSYDVIGVISPANSQPTVMVSQLLAAYSIPVVGSTATSDSLSDKASHPYFLRVAPPDKYQVSAMLRFVSDQGWSYISFLYIQGSYGEKAFDTFKVLSPSYGVCLATSHRLDDKTNYDTVTQDLLTYRRARVVILFVYSTQAKNVFISLGKLNISGHFIFIASDGMGTNYRSIYQGYENNILGMFSFSYYMSVVQEFYEYIRAINASESTNPWLKPVWENILQCSFSNQTCDSQKDILQGFVFYQTTSLYIDTVLTLAHGAHNLITKLCPGATGSSAKECINNGSYYQFLKNSSFDSYNGHVQFDSVGDVKGSYKINQVVFDYPRISFVNLSSATYGPEAKLIGVYSIGSQRINYTQYNIRWDHLNQEESVVPRELRPNALMGVPESVCSRPCTPSEYKLQKDPACCWECRECRDNERLIDNSTGCKVCDMYTWPGDSDFTTCLEIPLTHHSITDTLPLIQFCFGVAALVCACLVVFAYVYFRDIRVIKAASRELSILQMVAIFVGYFTVILFQFSPTSGSCGVLYFTFCLSFTWLYAPLLVKVIRIYRIFESGRTSHKRPRFVSPQSQLILTAFLIAIQVIICVYIYIEYKPTARKTQPILTEKYVELSCHMTLPGLVSFLTYNLVLICLCIVFAFKTRKLPDNFNESRFISMCVSTTLIIWMAFITTYFTASRDFVRAMVLSVTLLLNHSVAIVFLYAPKIYAAVYLPPEDFVTTRPGVGGTFVADDHRRSNRVAPLTLPTSMSHSKF
ncbi:metabotropic glutamate receptor 2 [Biomphalaria pfeifferi]|uniref:Metabotropic glutamate receptor 2 n=1 Tax=Biomphalaria pfeifferi TaxID=112525 RepID=A0AAD8C6J6_BIOPF|nr:metabotropic glutamate receptor 2 [Biomphalaria pfeifferi]